MATNLLKSTMDSRVSSLLGYDMSISLKKVKILLALLRVRKNLFRDGCCACYVVDKVRFRKYLDFWANGF